MSQRPSLKTLFSPNSIVIIGDTFAVGSSAHTILQNLLAAGFDKAVFPITADHDTVLGITAFCKVTDVPPLEFPEAIAVLCLPLVEVQRQFEALSNLGCKTAIIISPEAKETWAEEEKAKSDILLSAQNYGITIIGPNTSGVAFPHDRLNLFSLQKTFNLGYIGFFSQSVSMCDGISDWAQHNGFGFSAFICLGNKSMVDEADVITAMANDPKTKVIIGYIENVEHGEKFLLAAQEATRKKPVILMKAARTNAGARAAGANHGTVAGSDLAYRAAFAQAGIIRAHKIEDLFTFAQAFSNQPLPAGPSIGIVTTTGGPGIVAADACACAGLTLLPFSPKTIESLSSFLPSHSSILNPVNIGGSQREDLILATLEAVIEDPAVQSLFFLGSRAPNTSFEKVVELLVKKRQEVNKPVFACIMGGEEANETRQFFRNAGIACYSFPEQGARAAACMLRHGFWRENTIVKVGYRRDIGRAKKVIESAQEEGITDLAEYRAMELIRAYEMPVLETRLARTSDEAASIAKQLGYPVALKIASPHIVHKRDAGGVMLDISSAVALKKEFATITENAMRYKKNAYVAGCMVQTMAPKNSLEVVVGFKKDKHFGPMVQFSLGGIYRESFKDIACRLAPLSLSDAYDMIREIKFFPLLAAREVPPKLTALEDLLLIMSDLATDFPQIYQAECDPVFINENGAFMGGMQIYIRKP